MNRRWLISIILSVIIAIAGVSGVFYIQDIMPTKLTEASALVQTGNDQSVEEPVTREQEEIIDATQERVVQITKSDGEQGSGFLYNDKGDILTNAHVVANAKQVTITTGDSKEVSGEVIGISTTTDVAVVRVPALEDSEPLPLERDKKAGMLDKVLALGSPLGLQNTVMTGEITGLDREFDIAPFEYRGLYQISAPIQPGNSGGPLVDAETGKVIGINSAKLDKEAIGFSIPIPDIINLVERWSENPMESLPEIQDTVGGPGEGYNVTPIDQATYIVEYFYESINQGDFVTAYSLIGSSWQGNNSYENFRKGYSNTLSVTIDDLIPKQAGKNVEVTAFITVEETVGGEVKLKKYKLIYTVGLENDQLKILAGKGEEISS
ncbi:Trypsin-like peptidase domain-containing protein [Thalassobacillus cyri]|uniref:Trypsin-like peptidase domain-containing protein n=1 Tax=Thalassobacillus cyri TaxID=571932 RepID=A0A1H4FQ31_9BACI|nr:S1C family serine protease [Thalassobacillus cyri]SEA99469.1 Trypsin-like peptidase domain-containing protein [Thalassobacillus cyri]